MKALNFVSLVVGASLCVAVALILSRPTKLEAANVPGLIAGYKNWTRVNPEPKLVPGQTAILCAPASATISKFHDESPHRDKYVVVYVNDVGKAAMVEQLKPTFPQGSIIVKEKLASRDSQNPELLTVMRKREAGYDSANGDWEYMVFGGDGKSAKENGKLQKCQQCHAREKVTDYVSRDYLPPEVWKKLK